MEPIIGEGGGAVAAADVIKDSDTANFMADVIEASKEVPVIVDFWAPWCGPCKQLGPAIEKVVMEAKGAVKLVKINVDENQQIAAQLRVQSIPAVFAFKDGQPVDAFAGAVPESQIKEFVAKLTDGAGGDPRIEEALKVAEDMMAQGDHAGASNLYGQIFQHDPSNVAAIAGLAKCHVALGEVDEAKEILDSLDDAVAKDPAIQAVRSSIDLLAESAEAGDVTEARAKVETDPKNPEAHYDLAMALYGADDREGAVDALLESIQINRAWNDDAARKQMLKFFEAFGQTDPVTVDARRRLSAVLFS